MQKLKKFKLINTIIISLILIFGLGGCDYRNINLEDTNPLVSSDFKDQKSDNSLTENIKEDESYYRMEDVAAYIHIYNKLPQNYLTKKQARNLGWIPKKNNLWEVTKKGVIGGDRFGNFENNLPKSSYKEADVNYHGGKRNAERLVFDNEGNIFYTKDHYQSFERIYWW